MLSDRRSIKTGQTGGSGRCPADPPANFRRGQRLTVLCLTLCSLLLLELSLASSTIVAFADSETTTGAKSGPPNLILFLVDDLGWQDVSVPLGPEVTEFNRRYRTVHLEQLAAEGMRFTNAYASAPVCTPTRTSILTGQDPGRSQITYWILHRDKDTSRSHPQIAAPPWRLNGLSREDETLPKLLKSVGYHTIHAGKAHFGAHDTSGADPKNLGFDVNIAGHASGGPGSFRGTDHFSVAGREGKLGSRTTVWDVPGLEKYHGEEIFLTEAITRETITALEEAVATDSPFYLSFCPYAVHTPIMANEKKLPTYSQLHRKEAAYATMIETVDDALGQILATLDRLGVADKTLIIFSSDNGGLSAHGRGGPRHTHNAPLRSGKGSAYEGGTRVPTIIRWPGIVAAGSRSDTPIISQDFFATLLAAAGAKSSREEEIDAVDLSPTLRGEKQGLAERPLVWHQPHQWGASGPGIEPYTAIRRGHHKLIFFHAQPRFELYDLAADLGETDDLARSEPELVLSLAEEMERWFQDTGAQLSLNRATGAPIEGPLVAARDWISTLPPHHADWQIRSVSSEEAAAEAAAHAIDGDPSTIWHTKYRGGPQEHPHQITIDLGRAISITGVRYLPRPGGGNGTVVDYRVATSLDGQTFTTAAEGSFQGMKAKPGERSIPFDQPLQTRYLRFIALSEINGRPWASAAEIGVATE